MAVATRTKVFTHLWYATGADEAASFYASIFPDSRVDRVWALPVESPSGPAGSVKIVDFTLLGQRFQAMTAGRVADVMLKMVKLDIAALEKAYRG